MQCLRWRVRWRGFAAVSVLLSIACWPGSLAAQSKFASRLPANTIGYVEWHGSETVLSHTAKNHLLQLAFDPKFAPVWAALEKPTEAGRNKPGLGLEFPDVMSLLSNPLVVGAVELPASTAVSTPGTPGEEHVAAFLVYDATGKAELVQKLKGANPQAGAWTSYDFHGTQVESRNVGNQSTYRAQAANYYLISSQKQVIEELIVRFAGAQQPSSSLTHVAQYQETRKYTDSDAALEFFFRTPDISKWIAATSPQEKMQAQTLAALHLEKIHAAAFSWSFAGEATEMRGAVLGDTSEGGLFDLVGDSRAGFITEPLAALGSSYGASRVNWAAGYHFLREGLVGSLAPQQAASVTMAEAMAQVFLGMPVEDGLKLFTGEMASVTSYSEDGMTQPVYAATIQKPEAVLRILRAVAGHMIVAEDSAGTTAYLDVAYPYRDPLTGTQRRKFYYVAVTPDMLLVAPRKAMLRQAAALLASPAKAPAGVLANPEYQQLRARFPEKLTALSAADLTQIPWDKVAANLELQLEQGAKKQNGTAPTAAGNWSKSIPSGVISQHLHVSAGGWWKDANGVYIESYLQ